MTPLFCIILFVIFTYLIIGIFDIRQNIFVQSINSVGKGNICLTFDDGPDPIMTPRILEILNKHGIKGTFFLIGENPRFLEPEYQILLSDSRRPFMQ